MPVQSKFKLKEPIIPKDIVLKTHQVGHNARCCEIFQKGPILLDLSGTGYGKTYNMAHIAKTFNRPVGIVGPITVLPVWTRLSDESGFPLAFSIGYEKLRSKKHCQPKHGLLKRFDIANEAGAITTSFQPTEELLRLLREGILIVFDEFQHIKNKSDQYKACKAVAMACLQTGGLSRVAFLSGSPFDKQEHVINFLQLSGFIVNPTLSIYHKDRSELQLKGAQEMINVCKRYDAEATDHVLKTFRYDHNTVPSLCYKLYIDVLQKQIVSAMSGPIYDHLKDIKNGFYHLGAENMNKVLEAVRAMSAASSFNPTTNTVDYAKTNYGAIHKAQIVAEKAKLDIFERLARKYLAKRWTMEDGQPGRHKVIIALNFTAHLHEMLARMADFNPIFINGSVPQKKRPLLIDEFQRPDEEHCLFLCNMAVACEGIDLDDQEGHWPRVILSSSTYHITRLHQLTGRVARAKTVSKSIIRIVYVKEAAREMNILSALSKKTEVYKDTLQQQVVDGIIFPGDYQDEVEEDPTDISPKTVRPALKPLKLKILPELPKAPDRKAKAV